MLLGCHDGRLLSCCSEGVRKSLKQTNGLLTKGCFLNIMCMMQSVFFHVEYMVAIFESLLHVQLHFDQIMLYHTF